MADISSLPHIESITSANLASLINVGGIDSAPWAYPGTVTFQSGGGIAGIGDGHAYRIVPPKGRRHTSSTVSFTAPGTIADTGGGFTGLPTGFRFSITGSASNNQDWYEASSVTDTVITLNTGFDNVVNESAGATVSINYDNQAHSGIGGWVFTGGLVGTVTEVYVTYIYRCNPGIVLASGSYKNLGCKLHGIYTNPNSGDCRAFLYLSANAPDANGIAFVSAEDGGSYGNFSTMRFLDDQTSVDYSDAWICVTHRVDVNGRQEFSTWDRNGQVDTAVGYDNYPQGGCADKTSIVHVNNFGNTWESMLTTVADADGSIDLAYVGISETTNTPPDGFLTTENGSGFTLFDIG